MDRTYSNDSNQQVEFFVGQELEKTKFFGQKTLFVVGNKSEQEINVKISQAEKKIGSKIEHIYLAANHSWKEFKNFDLISKFINMGYNVTYECDSMTLDQVEHKLPLTNSEKFVLMLSVPVPNVMLKNKHTVIKIDDRDTNRNNPGIWCKDIQDMLNEDNLTTWDKYSNDIILGDE